MHRLLIAVVLAATCAWLPTTAGAATPRGFFGVMADGPIDDGSITLASQTKAMRAAHVGSIRIAVYWSQIEREPGVLDFAALDGRVEAAAAAKLDVLPVVLQTPVWARQDPSRDGSPPTDNSLYARFLTALIDRYGPQGTFWATHPGTPKRPLRRWQVWNEPELVRYFTPAADPGGWPAPYVALLKAGATAIRAADPGATVVAAGLTGKTWLDIAKLYAAGGRTWFDVAAIHPFSGSVTNVLKIISYTRSAMKRAGDTKKPLALTEVSWSSGVGRSKLNYGWESTEAGQASKVRTLLQSITARRTTWRLTGMWWYTWVSVPLGGPNSFDYSGLRRQTTGAKFVDKPALNAWRTTVAQLLR